MPGIRRTSPGHALRGPRKRGYAWYFCCADRAVVLCLDGKSQIEALSGRLRLWHCCPLREVEVWVASWPGAVGEFAFDETTKP